MRESGPEIKESFTIKCGDCETSLLEVLILKDGTSDLVKMKVYCELCGGSSFLIPIQGTHRICPVEGLKLINIKSDQNRNEEVWVGK